MSDNEENEVSKKQPSHTATLGFIEHFSFKPEEWPQWIKRFGRYRNATNLDQQTDKKQVSFLIISMGINAEDVLLAAGITDEDEKSYQTVVNKLNQYFLPKTNVVYERACFNLRIQKPGESVSDFITDVHKLASSCDYGQLRESLIRDRIIVGITDKKLSEQLQLISEITLEDTIKRVKQNETIKTQQNAVQKLSNEYQDNIQEVNKIGLVRHSILRNTETATGSQHVTRNQNTQILRVIIVGASTL